VTDRIRALQARREALCAQIAMERDAVARASVALVAPLAVTDVLRDLAADVREPPPLVSLTANLLGQLLWPRAAVVVRWGWYAFAGVLGARRALRVVRRAEASLPAVSP
jgi:predicted nucleic acid-binding Zn ribbon protein